MEVAINHVIAIAEKITRMEVLGEDSLGLGYIKIILSCLIRKNRSTIFYIEYNKKFKTAVVAIFIKESLVQQIAIKAHFLRISGYDIASRLEIVGKETITDEEIRTNYITLPHFVTLKDEIMRTLQNKKTNKP
jgi:hypothetical protein